MKVLTIFWQSLLVFCFTTTLASGAFNSGSTGADGALHITENTELQLPDDGVFNFTSVVIDSAATLTFKKNAQNTPITILATEDVSIAGTIDISGKAGNFIISGAGGPGGFDGGTGAAATQDGRRGEGLGGGYGGMGRYTDERYVGTGGGGGYAKEGAAGNTTSSVYKGGKGGSAYGNKYLIPLLGGSGGGAGGGTSDYIGGAGGGGGGAILIASSNNISVTGAIIANGGEGAVGGKDTYYGSYGGGGGGGAGGAIRLIANTISGNGTIQATGATGPKTYRSVYPGKGSDGRIRLEASTITRTEDTTPVMSTGYPYAIAPPDMPSLTISSIGGVSTPAAPEGDFGAPDIILPYNISNPIAVVVKGVNVPVNTTVTLKANPAVGDTTSSTGNLSGTLEDSSVTIDLNLSTDYPSVITAFVTYDLTASLGHPFYIDGERVIQMRIAAGLGEKSSVTYITESGKEIPASS